MHPVREKMNRALKAIAVPKLRQLGFKGSFPHFRRVRHDHVDLVVLQFNKYGGSFVAEIARLASDELASHYWNPGLSLSNATVYDASAIKRHRLGAIRDGDHWFIFGKENDKLDHDQVEADIVYERIAEKVAALVETEGEQWWSGL